MTLKVVYKKMLHRNCDIEVSNLWVYREWQHCHKFNGMVGLQPCPPFPMASAAEVDAAKWDGGRMCSSLRMKVELFA